MLDVKEAFRILADLLIFEAGGENRIDFRNFPV